MNRSNKLYIYEAFNMQIIVVCMLSIEYKYITYKSHAAVYKHT